MKVIILAAGQGTRLKPLTNNRPKCMVELLGKPILEHQLDVLTENNIKDIYVVTGYLKEKIKYHQITKKFFNENFKTTNMVESLFIAESIMCGDDLLITYGDIVFNKSVLQKVLNDKSDIGVVIDVKWRKYWEARMNNPLLDAETLKFNDKGEIKEIGKKASSYNEIEGQYIGMIKIKKEFINSFILFYKSLNQKILYDGKDFKNMYMTSFLQKITKELIPLKPIFIDNGWMEIDEPSDLDHFRFYKNN